MSLGFDGSLQMSSLKLGYVIHFVPNVMEAVVFYQKAFGITLRYIHQNGQFAQMETGDTGLCFCDETVAQEGTSFDPVRPGRTPPGTEIAFVAEDVAAAFNRAVSAGARVVLEPVKQPWGQVMSYVRDLNGFLVEICSPMDR